MLTGGAGYIGAHVARALVAAGHEVVVVDDLSAGIPARVPSGVPLVEVSVLDTWRLCRAIHEHSVGGVVHLAARKSVPESVTDPLLYYRENVGGFESLLRAVVTAGVRDVVLSSSAAVYGRPDVDLVTEDTPTAPINPYGESKLVCEWLLRAAAQAHGLRWIALRYFNAAGAALPELADVGMANLIPRVFAALADGRRPQVFGDDYPTPDGTCVRDFVHVADVADAHVAAAAQLDRGPVGAVYNVGRGHGASVREVIAVVGDVTGLPVDVDVVPRRAGDPPRVVADAHRITTELGWRARHDLRDMVASAWAGWQRQQAAPRR